MSNIVATSATPDEPDKNKKGKKKKPGEDKNLGENLEDLAKNFPGARNESEESIDDDDKGVNGFEHLRDAEPANAPPIINPWMTPKMRVLRAVVSRMYESQRLRTSETKRWKRLAADNIGVPEAIEELLVLAEDYAASAEKQYEGVLMALIETHPMWTKFLGRIKGIGPRLAGSFISYIITAERFDTMSRLLMYAGFGVNLDKDSPEYGLAIRREKGKKANWNNNLKVTCWKLFQSLMKARDSKYMALYHSKRDYIIKREMAKGNIIWSISENGKASPAHYDDTKVIPPKERPEKIEWSLGRVHAMAGRFMIKIFLCHLWEVWRRELNLPTRLPYAHEYMGHTTLIKWEDMLDKPVPKKRTKLDLTNMRMVVYIPSGKVKIPMVDEHGNPVLGKNGKPKFSTTTQKRQRRYVGDILDLNDDDTKPSDDAEK